MLVSASSGLLRRRRPPNRPLPYDGIAPSPCATPPAAQPARSVRHRPLAAAAPAAARGRCAVGPSRIKRHKTPAGGCPAPTNSAAPRHSPAPTDLYEWNVLRRACLQRAMLRGGSILRQHGLWVRLRLRLRHAFPLGGRADGDVRRPLALGRARVLHPRHAGVLSGIVLLLAASKTHMAPTDGRLRTHQTLDSLVGFTLYIPARCRLLQCALTRPPCTCNNLRVTRLQRHASISCGTAEHGGAAHTWTFEPATGRWRRADGAAGAREQDILVYTSLSPQRSDPGVSH
jgi:hypothetical protein